VAVVNDGVLSQDGNADPPGASDPIEPLSNNERRDDLEPRDGSDFEASSIGTAGEPAPETGVPAEERAATTGPHEGPEQLPPAVRARNFRLGVLNGAIYQTGEGLIDANTVIPLFLSRLTSSNALIGMASALSDLGWLLPQVFVAPWAARFKRQILLYRGAAAVRGLALAALAALVWPLRDRPDLLLVAFFACYTVFAMAAGFGGVAFMEVVGRVVPSERLGAFWSQRLFFGGLGLAVMGLVVRQILRLESFGMKFAILFGVGALIASAAYAMFSAIEEPKLPPPRAPGSALALLREGVRMLQREPAFRNLLLSRAALSVWLTVSPFMLLFAVRDLQGGPRVAGTFLFSRVAGFVLATLYWQALSRRHGTRAVLQVATLTTSALAFVACATALVSPWWRGWISAGAAVVTLELLASLGGAAQSGMLVGYASLVLELAPLDRRQSFVSLANTFIGPTMFLPLLGGTLVDWSNPPVLFGICGLVGLVGFHAATRLPRRA
jgi:MFS family permease